MSNSDFETGVVKSVADGKTIVELIPGAACDSCSARIICRPGKNGRHEVAVLNPVGAQPGQIVQLSETGNLLLVMSLLQYGLPLLGLLAGVFMAYVVDLEISDVRSELIMAAAGLVGMLLAACLARLLLRRLAASTVAAFRIDGIQPFQQ